MIAGSDQSTAMLEHPAAWAPSPGQLDDKEGNGRPE
jgi:hypothetical protein